LDDGVTLADRRIGSQPGPVGLGDGRIVELIVWRIGRRRRVFLR
jgi:hypothetical protein